MLAVFTYYKYEILYNIQSHLKKLKTGWTQKKVILCVIWDVV